MIKQMNCEDCKMFYRHVTRWQEEQSIESQQHCLVGLILKAHYEVAYIAEVLMEQENCKMKVELFTLGNLGQWWWSIMQQH